MWRPTRIERLSLFLRSGYSIPLILAVVLISMSGLSPAVAAVRIASWNLGHLGWNNDKDMQAVSTVIQRFDLVALQEVMKPAAARQLVAMVSRQSGDEWGIALSHALGDSSYKESYAILWRKSVVKHEGGTTVYLDPGNLFAREPLSSEFTVMVNEKPIRLTVATVHITYGDGKSDRAAEIRHLDEYWHWLGHAFEGKRILMGDFNMPPADSSWQAFDTMAKPVITSGASTLGQRGYANLYDNIWTDGSLPITASGIGRYPAWLGLDHATAIDHVSDHAPVYVVLGTATVETSESRAPLDSDAASQTECIDLNNASVVELDQLEHVGPSRAKAIVRGRPWHGIGELKRVSGLSSARVKDIAADHSTCALP